ncbi:Crossover junction endonuclease MUS81 [Nymphon striatum]|nr:Crossover junction endonuclease MUS81 [Nymphon striatum]
MIDKKINEFGGTRSVEEKYGNISQEDSFPMSIASTHHTEKSDRATNFDGSEDETNSLSKKLKTKRYSVAGYCPLPRSGSYAILLALFKNFQNGSSNMSKQELIDAAQSFCDSSFIVPEPGSYYTAWSNMGTLIKRTLVKKEYRPPRYSLTDNGIDLASAIFKAEDASNINNADGPSNELNVIDHVSNSEYTNLKESDKKEQKNNRYSGKVYYHIDLECSENVSVHRNHRLDAAINPSSQRRCLLPGFYDIILIVDVSETNGLELGTDFGEISLNEIIYEFESLLVKNGCDTDFILLEWVSLQSYIIPMVENNPTDYLEVWKKIFTSADIEKGASIGSKNSKSLLIPELRKNGVNFEVRKLHIGDFVWIAKERVSPVPGCLQIKPPVELLLNFIIERKRMDDLASSIKDGRFHEQKVSLFQS